MDHVLAVGIVDGLANIEEVRQQLAELDGFRSRVARPAAVVKPLDGQVKAMASNERHDVERPAVGVAAQPEDGHDPRMAEAAGDLGLADKPLLVQEIARVVGPDLLEGDLAFQVFFMGHEDLAQPAPRMAPEDLVAHSHGGRAVGATRGRLLAMPGTGRTARVELGDGRF